MSLPDTATPIPPIDLAAERAELGAELDQAVLRTLHSGQYVLGPEVASFERDFARLHGAEFGVGVGSGTDALIVGLKALGVGPGDGVVTSPFTFFASAGAIAWIGARPILADVEAETALLDPERVAEAIEEDTRCILPIHLYGQLADMGALRAVADEHGLALLEDAAQAHGARRDGVAPGQLGDAAAFSFYPTKNLGAAGEGGMVLTDSEETADRLRRLRDHGSTAKYRHGEIGTNTRLQAVQAGVLNVKLPYLAAWNERRRAVAAQYDSAFAGSDAVRPLARVCARGHAFHQYTVRVDAKRRDPAVDGLRAAGVFVGVHYPLPVHLQEAARVWGFGPGSLPIAEALAREVLCLPIHPFLTPDQVERVSETLLGIVAG
ncbi:MAG: DegT/DnrJ/EryC1/StrS family aminotransferase [Planctomycetota bacterium]|nr:DegT/DnrJ/EryC1/StrS family aminotransferase [Planctomycetota bacterium]